MFLIFNALSIYLMIIRGEKHDVNILLIILDMININAFIIVLYIYDLN